MEDKCIKIYGNDKLQTFTTQGLGVLNFVAENMSVGNRIKIGRKCKDLIKVKFKETDSYIGYSTITKILSQAVKEGIILKTGHAIYMLNPIYACTISKKKRLVREYNAHRLELSAPKVDVIIEKPKEVNKEESERELFNNLINF